MNSTPQTPSMPMFHTNVAPVSAEQHAGLRYNAGAGYGFAAGVATVPIGIAEFETAAHSYPILFTDASPPVPVVLLGVRAGWNLFVNDTGAWMPSAYIPALVRAYPFVIVNNNKGGQFLGFEPDAACISPTTGTPLFENGQPTQLVNDMAAFCTGCQAELNAAADLGAALERAQLLTPQSAKIELKSGGTVNIDGFRIVDRNRLATLNDEVLLAWRTRGWLMPLYAHLFSAANWVPFTELATRQLAIRS
jgi:hypothetical protein